MVGRGSTRPVSRLAAGIVVVAALAACQGDGTTAASSGGDVGAQATATASPAASISLSPVDGSTNVRLDRRVTVAVAEGTLSAVTVTLPDGKALTGTMSDDKTSWTSAGPLRADSEYAVTASAVNRDGETATSHATFSTLKPKQTASITVLPQDGWTVGVGMPIIVNFTRSVQDRAAAEKALTVTTTPTQVEGDWRWFSSRQVQWRPKTYWPSGTRVHLSAALSGVELAPDVWGKRNVTTDFSIGSAMISTVDVRKHTLTVRKDGKVIRVIPVTTGKAGYLTRNGIKVIISRETTHRMDAASLGTDKDDPEYYNIVVKYAMRLTWSGEFFHAAPWSVGSQGRANVSHGCTGMSTANAQWLFNHSKVGDVAIYTGSKRALEWGNGYTAWDMSYAEWTKG